MTITVADTPDPGDFAAKASEFYAEDVRGVIVYISPGNPAGSKTVKKPHIDAIHAAGIAIMPVCETWGGSDNFIHHDINAAFGTRDGGFCGHYMQTLGFPEGSGICPTVDNDVSPSQFAQLCAPYFQAFRAALPSMYRMGAYGCGELLFGLEAITPPIMTIPWLSNALGWSRSREYLMTDRAVITQQRETRLLGIDIDPDVVKGDLAAAGFWMPPAQAPSVVVAAGSKAGGTDIVATCFGGPGDREASAYGGMVDPNAPGVALPYRFADPRPKVRVTHGGTSVDCTIVDVGPHNTNDPYWSKAARPLAENQAGNHAGIDMTPAVFTGLGIEPSSPDYGMTRVDWEFV